MHRMMCAPTYFDIEYVINPWMDLGVKVDRSLAHKQWKEFVAVLKELGDSIDFIDPDPRCPDMTFSGDAGLVFGRTFVPSNFRVKERMLEVEHYTRWFRARNYAIHEVDPSIAFEGLGDVVFSGRQAVFGHGVRSDIRSLDVLNRLIPELRVHANLRIVDDRFFHLAMACAFLDEHTVMYYPPAFDAASVARLEQALPGAIAVSEEDATRYFACNNVVVGRKVLLDGCTAALRGTLEERGFEAVSCAMSEFKKSGGSLRCLVLSFIEDHQAGSSGL
jgi:N-dimethylarginine dimethylaminohydrolase